MSKSCLGSLDRQKRAWQRMGGLTLLPGLTIAVSSLIATCAMTDEPYFVDLRSILNADLEDDGIANNGRGGWTDEGINDMFLYPPLPLGRNEYRGYRFQVIDPKANGGRSVLILKGQKRCRDKPLRATARVPGVRGKYVFFLQNAAAHVPDKAVATYTIAYADGTAVDFPIRDGIEIHQWWVRNWWENKGETRWLVHLGRNPYTLKWRANVGLWATRWVNPHPAKAITSITFQSHGKSVPIIFAVTIANDDYAARRKEKANDVRRPPNVPAGYFDRKQALENRMLFHEMVRHGHVKGLRRVEVIRADLVAVTVDAALGETGAGPGEAKAAGFQRPESFRVASATDPDYGSGRRPAKVGRKSYEYWNGNIGPFPQNMLYWHTYYLALPRPLKSGHQYTITVEAMSADYKRAETLRYDEKATRTPAIKINQVAYAPIARRRYAYLGWWAGDMGAVDYSGLKRFTVIDEATGRAAHEGEIRARAKAESLSGEDVYEMDISTLEPGTYHIRIPGLGRSDSFDVGGPKLKALYYHTHRAFYHQRCGHVLKKPYTDFAKPSCHLDVYEGGHLVSSRSYAARKGEKVRRFRGGYHDAADFDVFTYHLRATAQALTAYAFAPAKFTDGDLNIPESGNGIPDILDEADWALFSYRDLQRSDGAIPLGRGNDQDAIRGWESKHKGARPPYGIFPPRSTSSSEYAAVAAQYARLVRKFDAARAEKYLASARRAYAWSKANLPAKKSRHSNAHVYLAWAAAELFSATGDPSIHRDFKRLHAEGHLIRLHWKTSAMAPILWWPYIACRRPDVDADVQAKLKAALLKRADHVIRETERAPYRVGRGPQGGGNGWGNLNGGGQYADPCLRAYMLTREQKYLDAACLNADFQLGANPLSKTFITGLGVRPPEHPQISAFLYTGPNKTGPTVKGITVYGLTSRSPQWYPKEIPSWRRWRDLGNGGDEVSSEFTITETVGASALLYATLYALAK